MKPNVGVEVVAGADGSFLCLEDDPGCAVREERGDVVVREAVAVGGSVVHTVLAG